MADIVEIVIKASDQTGDAFKQLQDNLTTSNKKGIDLTGTFKALGIAGAALGAALSVSLIAVVKESLDATTQWGEQLDRLGDQFGMSGEKASGFALAAEHVGLNVDEMSFGLNYFTRGLDTAQTTIKNATDGLDKLGKPLTTTEAKIKDNTKQIADWKKQLADAEVNLQRATKRLNEAKNPTDAMRYAVDDARKKVAELNDHIKKTPPQITEYVSKTKQAVEATDPFSKAMNKLGLSMFDAQGKAKTFDALLPEIMDKFSKLPPGVEASALAMDLFGARGGSKFLDFLRQGSSGIANFTEEAKKLGLSLSTQQVTDVEEFGFALNDVKSAMEGVWVTIGSQLLPYVRQLVDFINKEVLPGLKSWVDEAMPNVIAGLRSLMEVLARDFLPLLQTLADDIKTGDFSKIPQDIGDIFGKIWEYIKPVLSKLLDDFTVWVQSPETQSTLKEVGGAIASAILSGMVDLIKSEMSKQLSQAALDSLSSGGLYGELAKMFGVDVNRTVLKSLTGFQTEPGQSRMIPGSFNQPVPILAHGGEIIGRPGNSNPDLIVVGFDRNAYQTFLQPFIEKGVLQMRSRQVGATRQ